MIKVASTALRTRDAAEEVAAALPRRSETALVDRKGGEPTAPIGEAKETPSPMPMTASTNPALGPLEEDAADLPPMPPMPTTSQTAPSTAEGGASGSDIVAAAAGQPRREEATRAAADSSPSPRDRRPAFADQGTVRSSDQLLATLPPARAPREACSESPRARFSSCRRP